MTTRTILAALAAVLTAAITTTALAASAAKDPKTMVLQKSDFPAGARLTAKHSDAGGLLVTYRYRTGSKQAELSSFVAVLPSRKLAVSAYRELRSDVLDIERRLTLPKYGDEQVAGYLPITDGQLIVRKGNTVWALILGAVIGTPELTTAEAIVEFKRYGPKQMRRVGSG
jgi:hypothetical protein